MELKLKIKGVISRLCRYILMVNDSVNNGIKQHNLIKIDKNRSNNNNSSNNFINIS